MKPQHALALTTGLLSALWGWCALLLGLPAWAGFLGCTTRFVAPVGGLPGLLLGCISNLSGVFWALVILWGSALSPEWQLAGYLLTGGVSTLMCLQARQRWLSLVPGTFIGCSATFACAGNWQLVIPALLLGNLFGYAMQELAQYLRVDLVKEPNPPVMSSDPA
jgi:hypothetical protein